MAGALAKLRRLRRAILLALSVSVVVLGPPGFVHYLRDPDPGFLAKNLQIVSLLPGSAAEEAGLQPGDRVVAVNGVRVRFQSELGAALHAPRSEPDYSVAYDREGGG